jgi:3-oxoacyl-[acyl-carrier-protein] synthase II
MKVFIRATGVISPQSTFGQLDFAAAPLGYLGKRLLCMEPDYSMLIDPKSLRRMSRIIRIGVAAAMDCLSKAKLVSPDAIITGTAYGCLEDTAAFLTKMVQNAEEMLTPTPFIQSTHNTVGAQIALALKCHGYNNTFVHRGSSFEHALLDAVLLLREKEANRVLVGGLDEITDTSYAILSRFGLYRRKAISSLELFNQVGQGTLCGEGAAFFLLTNLADPENMAELVGTHSFYNPRTVQETQDQIRDFLTTHAIQPEDLDLIIMGQNGDRQNDQIYDALRNTLFEQTQTIGFKHLCGEYPTAGAFGLWLGACCIQNRLPLPWYPDLEKTLQKRLRRILMYNHFQNTHHTLCLVSAS